MAILDRDAILQARDARVQKLHVPEWGGDVYIRVMSADDRDDIMSQFRDGVSFAQAHARFAAKVLCDKDGGRLFSDDELAKLGGKSGLVLERIWEAAAPLNGIGGEAIEELEKNSEPTVNVGSGSN